MKIVCVTQRLIHDKKTNTFKDGLDKELLDFLNKLGYLTLPIPNLKLSKSNINKILKIYVKRFKISGFVLSGGEDFGINKNRDKIENLIIKYCEKNKFPLLGICRGLQAIVKSKKINLVKIKNHVNKRHAIFNLETKKYRIVNSYHNWSIMICPKEYEILYATKDKYIEGIKHKKYPIKAVMWHPERENKYSTEDKNLFWKTLR
tara:strand:+ start:1143 stop:1754 length:612 start_codon:yes stop_codon:yes gene_type:complete